MDKENSLKNRMFMKKYLSLAGTTVALSMGSISLLSEEAYAREWIATTDAQMVTKVKAEDGQYTFEEGDTFWVIGYAINIQPFKLMEWNTFQVGSQYTVPIGTTIYWSGDQVTIKDAAGNVVYEKDATDEDKIDPNKSVAFQSPNLPNTSGQTNNTVTKQKETHSNEKQPSFGKENGSSTPSIKPVDTKYDTTIYYVDTEGANIFPMDRVDVKKGEVYTAVARELVGYTLLGNKIQTIEIGENHSSIIFVYEKNSMPIMKTSTVTINYVTDKEQTAEKFKVPVGELFEYIPKVLPGYQLRPDSLQSISEIIEGDRTFTFVYEKIKPVVTIYSVDKDGNRINTETIEVHWGNELHYTPSAIPGYRLADDSLQSISETIEGDQAFTFVYEKIHPVVTIYSVDKDGNRIDTETIEVPWGNELHFTPSAIPGYRLADDSLQSISETIEGDQAFTFVYEKIKPVVTIYSVDKDGNMLDTKTIEVPWGNEFHFTPSAIPGYRLTDDSLQSISETIEGNQAFTFVYEKIKPVVTIYSVDKDGNMLDTETIEVPWGNEFHFTPSAIPGYRLTDDSLQSVSETIEGDQAFTFVYEKIKPVVTIYSVDKDGNMLDTKTIEVPWGNEFHFTPSAIPGYRLTDDSLQSVSETIEGDQAFTFIYEKIKPVVTIYSMDKDGNMLDTETIEVPWGNEFHFTPSAIPGYRLTTDSPQSIVEVIEENKNFTFIYEKIDPVVTIHSIDKNGKLLKTETFDVPSGTEFHYTPSEINGHLLATDSPQFVSEVIEEDKEFTFVYEKINLVVTIYYFYIDFEIVLKTEKLTVPWGDVLHYTPKPPRTYKLTEDSIQTIDEVIEENKEFTFLITFDS